MVILGGSMAQEFVKSFKIESDNKVKTIYTGNLDFFEISIKYESIIAVDSFRYVQGKILSINDEFLRIYPKIDNKYIWYDNDSSIRINNTVCSPNHTVDIKISDIGMIENHSNSNFNLKSFGDAAIITGSITALLIAPLVSIKYKTGEFNGDTYLKTVGVGLSFVTIGIPISILSRPRKYFFARKCDGKEVKLWKIKNDQ